MGVLEKIAAARSTRGLKGFSQPPFWSADRLRLPSLSSTPLRPSEERIENDFAGYVDGMYKANGTVFACILARQWVFSEARFQFRRFTNGRPGDLFGRGTLDLLEHPWPGGTTGELLQRMEQDASLAGNFWATKVGDNGLAGNAARGNLRVAHMRPDRVTMIIGSNSGNPNSVDARVVGALYKAPHAEGFAEEETLLLPGEVVHYSPIPDPLARFRGMSWLTPLIREIEADKLATTHKAKFFENAAVPNLVVKFDKDTSDDDYDEFVEGFNAKHQGAWNAYKCLHPDTDVAMWDGRRVPARDVAEGDLVVAWVDGKPAPGTVSAAEWQPESPIVTVTTQRGRVIRTNDRHPFLVGDQWVDASKLQPGDMLTTGLGWADETAPSELSEHDAWILGALTGDGCLVSSTPVVSAWDEGVRSRLSLQHELRSTGKGHDYRMLGVTKLARQAGLTGKRSWEKRIPEQVMTGPARVAAAYLSGLIDTDGHLADPKLRRTMELGITSVSRDLLVDAQHLLASLGINSSVSCSMPASRGDRDRDAWRLCAFGNAQARRLAEVLDLSCASKAERLAQYASTPMLNRRDSSRFDRVVSVEVTEPEPTIGLEIAEHHTHVTGGVVTHNTLFLMGGADVTPLTMDFKQLEFSQTQGKGESRIAAAAGVPPSWVGFSEGLQGSSLNAGNFTAARRRFADGTIRPLWRMAVASLQSLVTPPAGAELWYDERDIAFLREDAKDQAEIQGLQSRTIRTLLDAGYEGPSVVAAVLNSDWSLLAHSGLFSVQLQAPGTEAPRELTELPQEGE